MRRAAIYARYSTDLQSDRSIDDQVALCRRWCESEGIIVAKVFSDRAKTSASILGRDGLLSMMEQARAGAFDIVVAEALDRISRDQEDLAHVFKRLEFAGVEMRAVHDGAADAVQIGLRGIMGAMFLRDLKHKIRRGMAGVARDGRNAGGKAYGYRPIPGQPGEMEIEEGEAEVIRRIYNEFLSGRSPRGIAAGLNEDGIAPPRGARWNASTLNGNAQRGYGILRNRLYKGELVWNRIHMVRNPETGRRVSRTNPESEWEIIPVPKYALMPAEIFDAVQARLSGRSRGCGIDGDRKPKRVFSGLLKCGCCGGGISISKRRGTSVWGRCSVRVESGACDNRREMRIDRIETAVLDRLGQDLLQPEYVHAYLTEYQAERNRLAAELRRDLRQIEREAVVARQAATRTMDLLIRNVISGPKAEDRCRAQMKEADAAEARLARAQAAETEEPVVLHPATTERYINTIRELGQEIVANPGETTAAAMTLIRELVAEVSVTPQDDGSMAIEVTGHLAALLDEASPSCRGLMVAEEGLEPPTRGL